MNLSLKYSIFILFFSILFQIALKSFFSPQLDPYRTQLESIIADIGLNDQLLAFSADQQEGVVKSEHRGTVIPFLIRILFSKLSKVS